MVLDDKLCFRIDATLRRRRFRFAVALAFSVAAAPLEAKFARGQTTDGFWEQRITPKEESTQNSAPIRLHIDFGDHKRLFILDTGTSRHRIDKKLVGNLSPLLGYKTIDTPFGEKSLPVHVAPSGRIGETNVILGEVGLEDLNTLSRVMGDELAGIVGLPFVVDYGFGYDKQCDYFYIGRCSVRAFDAIYSLEYSGSAELYTYDIKLAIGSLRCLIDSGMNTAMSVQSSVFDELSARGLLRQMADVGCETLNGRVLTRFGIIGLVEAWGTRLTDVPVIEGVDNMIGLDLLKRFSFSINVADDTIEIGRHKDTTFPFKWDQSGIEIICADKKITIDAVKPLSPGERSGLTVGASIIEVNEKCLEANWRELFRLRDLFSTPSPMTVRLLVEQNGLRQSIELAW